MCDSVEWLNGLSNPVSESYHPNRPASSGYATVVSPSLVGTAYTASASTLTKAALRAGSLAAQQRRYAAGMPRSHRRSSWPLT